MSRIARVVLPGVPCHVTQRGNGRQQVFFDETDYRLYLDLLRRNAAQHGVAIWAYCLMPNHVHLVAVPSKAAALARTLGRTHADFARHFNLRQRSCGHVWQARFFSCPLDAAHLWRAAAYIERNPARAGMVARADQYRWSSAHAHTGGGDRDQLLDLRAWQNEYDPIRWKNVLETSVSEEALGQRIHEASLRGRPLGDDEFVRTLEAKSGRRLRPHPVGRPKSSRKDELEQLTLAFGV